MKKKIDSEHVCNENCLMAKKRSYEGKINTNFHSDQVPKVCSQDIFLSVILIDSVFTSSQNYYPQVL